MVRRALLLLSFIIVFVGCAARQEMRPLEDDALSDDRFQFTAISGSSPFSLFILEDYYDGSRLYVKGKVDILERGRLTEDVALRLITINDGGFQESEYYGIEEVGLGEGGSGGSSQNFLISMNAGDLSEYQVELLWGQEASHALRQRRPAITKSLEIRGIEVTGQRKECFFEPCEVAFELQADLINTGETIIDRATLGLGFVLEGSQSGRVPDGEESVLLTDLNLLPGHSKPLRLTFDQTVQESLARKLMPSIRLISFE